MGCCLGTTTKSPPQPDSMLSKSNSKAPQPPVEEETVKEVLLETPFVMKNEATTKVGSKSELIIATPEDQESSKNELLAPLPENQEPKVDADRRVVVRLRQVHRPAEEITITEPSEVSDLCSFTESFSTTTAPEKKDEDGEVNQRSPARKRRVTGGGRMRGNGAPTRQSPEKRGPARQVHRRTAASGQGRNVGLQRGVSRDAGESSGRRSRSPAVRGDVGGRQNVRSKSPAARGEVGNRQNARSRSPAARGEVGGWQNVSRKSPIVNHGKRVVGPPPVTVVNGDGGGGGGGGEVKKPDGVVLAEAETLENPVVSMECFIFL